MPRALPTSKVGNFCVYSAYTILSKYEVFWTQEKPKRNSVGNYTNITENIRNQEKETEEKKCKEPCQSTVYGWYEAGASCLPRWALDLVRLAFLALLGMRYAFYELLCTSIRSHKSTSKVCSANTTMGWPSDSQFWQNSPWALIDKKRHEPWT